MPGQLLSEQRWLENDSHFIIAHQQPATLMDILGSRGIDNNRLLRHTGILYEDVLQGQLAIAPNQLLKLIENSEHLYKGNDLSFVFGHRIFPGNYGSVTDALLQSANLNQALDIACSCHTLISPLITPHKIIDKDYCHIYFYDTSGSGKNQRFILETMMTAFSHLGRWNNTQKAPWRFSFNYPQPEHIEQYQVHLGPELSFNAQFCAMQLPVDYLFEKWKEDSTAYTVARQQCLNILEQQPNCFLYAVIQTLHEHIKSSPSLESTACHFHMSPATFKRKLKKHGARFQSLQDQIRKQMALYLFQHKSYNNEQVAEYLNFNDINNFRRSFKRWTGMTPSLFRNDCI